MEQKKMEIAIKVTDETLKGLYSNNMLISHTPEEFILDFLNIVPPHGILNARIITSPGHIKRIVKAMVENISKYEQKHGKIEEAEPPQKSKPVIQ